MAFSTSKKPSPKRHCTKENISVKIIIAGLALAATWTAALIFIASTAGLHSTQGMWLGAIGLPGVVISNWLQANVFHNVVRGIRYSLMLLINWGFFCSVLQGIISVKRGIWKS